MRKNLEHWVGRLETANGHAAGEVGITQDDGTLPGPRGEWTTRNSLWSVSAREPAVLTISAAEARL